MNPLDIGLAFLEGLALIVSPCILPVLPLVLGASVDGGRRRPYGIILGFVLAFSIFAIVARKAVAVLGVDLDSIKGVSLALLALFGVVLLSARLSERFSALTQGVANLGNRLASAGTDSARGNGLLSGLIVGALIGLVWTPCAGPVLAAVLVQVIRQQSDLVGLLVIVSFALGAGIPMLAIALAGRKIIARLGFFARHAEAMRRAFGVVILASVAYIGFGASVPATAALPANALAGAGAGNTAAEPLRTAGAGLALEDGLGAPYAAPQFAGNEAWLNSPPLTMQSLRGKVVLVDFWTYSCINCVRTLPYVIDWDRKYRDQGLVVIGVHSPEFEFEKNADNVKAAMAQYGIRYPVVLDNTLDTWSNFANRYWPAHYLIDRNGRVVYTHFGEGEYGVTENNIRYLLGLGGKAEAVQAKPAYMPDQTPETYLGYERAESYGGAQRVVFDAIRAYRFPAALPADAWALNGEWKVESEKIISGAKGAALRLDFTARKVFLVLGTSTGKPLRAMVTLNGAPPGPLAGKDAPAGAVTVGRNTLYELLDQGASKKGVVEIIADEPGLEAYAFTFGS